MGWWRSTDKKKEGKTLKLSLSVFFRVSNERRGCICFVLDCRRSSLS